jgi:hypothetical protein
LPPASGKNPRETVSLIPVDKKRNILKEVVTCVVGIAKVTVALESLKCLSCPPYLSMSMPVSKASVFFDDCRRTLDDRNQRKKMRAPAAAVNALNKNGYMCMSGGRERERQRGIKEETLRYI